MHELTSMGFISAPTAPPENITTQTLNSTEILVTWDPPPLDTQNGKLSGYKVCNHSDHDLYFLASVSFSCLHLAEARHIHFYSVENFVIFSHLAWHCDNEQAIETQYSLIAYIRYMYHIGYTDDTWYKTTFKCCDRGSRPNG